MTEAWERECDLKHYKKTPIHIVEEHNDALQFIYSAIGAKRLPVEGTTLLHLDAHPDMLISRQLNGNVARAGRKLLPLLEIENWIVPAAAAGHINRVVWLRPPWAHQMTDGTRTITVGDHPETGLLRVDSAEPYYLSDALYTPHTLVNAKKFSLTVAELGDPVNMRPNEEEHVKHLANNLQITAPYVLDIDLDFFSTGNPFLSLYDNIGLYDRLEPIFSFELPVKDDIESVVKVVGLREKQLNELERLFNFLEEHGSLKNWDGERSLLFNKVYHLSELLIADAEQLDESPDWWAVFAAGCTRDQGGLPVHYSSPEELASLARRSLRPLLNSLPPPVLVTIARSSDDGYCPPEQVDEIQALVLSELKEAFNTDEPHLYYLTQQ